MSVLFVFLVFIIRKVIFSWMSHCMIHKNETEINFTKKDLDFYIEENVAGLLLL